MFDQVNNPARGRNGGQDGQAGRVEMSDGTKLRGKGYQLVRQVQRLRLPLPGGDGYGDLQSRDPEAVRADLEAGLITDGQAKSDYGIGG